MTRAVGTDNFIIVGDQAWTPAEWEAEQARRARRRKGRPDLSPEQAALRLERKRAYMREYMRVYLKQEKWRTYKREWTRRKRAAQRAEAEVRAHDYAKRGKAA